MSRLAVATWNAEGMFVVGTRTRRGSPDDAIAVVKELDADIITIPEFGRYQQLMPEHRQALTKLGYSCTEIPYEQEDLAPEVSLVVLSRLAIRSSKVHRLGGMRNYLELRCLDKGSAELRIIAVHLDDRSEQLRLKQIVDVEHIVMTVSVVPTLVMGDLNAMDKSSNFARVARSRIAKTIIRLIPHHQLKGMALRVNEMAIGTTIQHFLNATNLHNLDPGIKRTISAKQYGVEWAPKMKLAKIDWIFGTDHFNVEDYQVWRDVGSDHRPVRATLCY